MKKQKFNGIKKLKRTYYKSRTTKFKRLVATMFVVGIIASLVYFARYAFIRYSSAGAEIVLTYPEIAQSKYPDGKRFTYYDFISEENVQKALEIMQEKGKYKNFTVDDFKNSFYLYSYLEDSAGASVSSARSEGNDFSYVANEYKITYVQPHDYKGLMNEEITIKEFLFEDYSTEFLEALVEVNRVKFAEESGGVVGFKELSTIPLSENYDYSEKLAVYRTKINAIISYFKYHGRKNPDFVSKKTNMTIKDIEGKYQFLISNSLNGISDFIESSGISKDTEMATNKLNVSIENNTLKYNKYIDRAQVNDYAMKNYAQTFTENLINVIQNSEYGLYQARPKTAFDTVVVQKHVAEENVAEYGSKILRLNKELATFSNIDQTPDEKKRLIEKCDNLMSSFEEEYRLLSEDATIFVDEYYNCINENYISSKVTPKSIINKKVIINMAFAFTFGAAVALIMFALMSSHADSRRLKRKYKLIQSIKNKSRKGAKKWDL